MKEDIDDPFELPKRSLSDLPKHTFKDSLQVVELPKCTLYFNL